MKKDSLRESFLKGEKIMMNKNKVVLCGKITDPFEIAFVMGGYTYLKTRMTIKRYSQYEDVIPLIIRQDLLLKNNCEYRNKFFEVKGSFNSKNRADHSISLFVYVKELNILKKELYKNQIIFDGFLCKKPVLRTTPLGKEITDLCVATNRKFTISDYIPCICWGKDAIECGKLKISTHLYLQGRIQSRIYCKSTNNGELEKEAYEVSVKKIKTDSDAICKITKVS